MATTGLWFLRCLPLHRRIGLLRSWPLATAPLRASLLATTLLINALITNALLVTTLLHSSNGFAAPAATPAAASTAKVTIRMGVHHFPPDFVLSSHQGKQRCDGPGVARTRRILASQQLELQTYCVTPARMYLLLDKGELDLAINIKSTKALQQQQHQFASPAYSELELMLYSHSRSSQAPRDNSVAAIRGFDYQGQRQAFLARGFQLIDLPDATSAIDLFAHQRSQHLLTYQGPLLAHLAAQGKPVPTNWRREKLAQIPTFYVISAQSPYQQLLLDTLQTYASSHQCQRFDRCPP